MKNYMTHIMLILLLFAIATGVLGFSNAFSDYSNIIKLIAAVFMMLCAYCLVYDLFLRLDKKS